MGLPLPIITTFVAGDIAANVGVTFVIFYAPEPTVHTMRACRVHQSHGRFIRCRNLMRITHLIRTFGHT